MFEKNVVHFIYCDVEYQLAEVRSGLGAAGEGGGLFFLRRVLGRAFVIAPLLLAFNEYYGERE